MSQPLDDDLFDDLAEPEGRAHFDEADALEDLADPHGADPLDPFEMGDAGDGVEFDAAEVMDELEDAVAEALDADDADEFLGNLWKGIRSVAKKVAPIVSQVAPLLPIPGAGLIGKAADIVSQVAADEADELDAFDAMIDIADEADSFDAAAPIAAALAIRKAVPNVARLPHQQRKQLVKAASVATRHIAQRHGPAAAAAVPAIVRQARRVAVQQGVPARQLPQLVRRTAARVARSPQLVRRFARASSAMRTAPGMAGGMGWEGPGMGTAPGMAGGMGWEGPGTSTAPGMAGGIGSRRRGMRRRRRGYGWGGYGWGGYGGEGGLEDGWGRRGMATRRRGRLGRYGYAPRAGGGAWGDRRITLQPGEQVIIASI
jgi:hypothetical protein